jgi:Xaa-Pro aminopeptidase
VESSTIPPEEYPKRWNRLQEALGESGLDLLIAYADDHATAGPAHVRYLADFPAHFEPVCIAVPATGEPVLLSGPESEEYARLKSQVQDIRVVREFTHPDEEYPFTTLVSLQDILAELRARAGRPLKRVGLAGLEIMSVKIHQALTAALSGVELVDAEEVMTRLRAVKSEAERQVIAYAYRIAEAGMRACFDTLEVGVTERQIAAAAEYAMRSLGAEGTGIDTIIASGPNTRPILARTSFRPIEEGDLVLFTIAPRYEGYHAAIGRPVFIGEPPGEIRRAMETAVEAQQAAMAAMRPGARGGDVEGAARRVVEAAGMGSFFLYSGVHSVGVVEFEPPIFGPGSDELLQENMVLSIDVPLFHAPWGGLRYEDGYLVAAAGARPLDNFKTGVLAI